MYCKYCGNRIAENSNRCSACGAKIDLGDGGQTYFDDGDLEAWKSDDLFSNENRTVMPQEPATVPGAMGVNVAGNMPINSKNAARRGRRFKKSSSFKMSKANKLIILCIAIALVVVLGAVATISILTSNKDTDNGTKDSKTDTAESTQIPSTGGSDENAEATPASDDGVFDCKIALEGDSQSSASCSVRACMKKTQNKDVLYISARDLLEALGYNGNPTTEDENTIYRYDPKDKSKLKTIKVYMRDPKIGIVGSNEEKSEYNPSYDNKIEDGIVYVPARSFLSAIGYDDDTIKYDDSTLTAKINSEAKITIFNK